MNMRGSRYPIIYSEKGASMATPDKQFVVVTGGTSGIGLQLARLAAKDGHDLLIVAQDPDKLAVVARQLGEHFRVSVDTLEQDLSKPGAAKVVIDYVGERQVDVLINNAGFGDYGEFALADTTKMIAMMQVNVVVVAELLHWVLPQMIKRRSGHVLNLASTAAFLPGPLMATYYATKAFVLSLSEAVDEELTGTGVHVTVLAPGPTATSFEKTAHVEESRIFHPRNLMRAEDVAEAAWKGVKANKRLVIPGMRNKLTAFVVRLLPRRWAATITYHAQKRVP